MDSHPKICRLQGWKWGFLLLLPLIVAAQTPEVPLFLHPTPTERPSWFSGVFSQPVTVKSSFNDNSATGLTHHEISPIDSHFFGYYQVEGGAVRSGQMNEKADDGTVVYLILPGRADLMTDEQAGPSLFGTHLQSQPSAMMYRYGLYRVRLKAAACARGTDGVVSGLFTYYRGSLDRNGNTLTDNQEIDIEVNCADPQSLHLTLWSDYDDDELFRKKTRRINLATGEYMETAPGHEQIHGLASKGRLDLSLPLLDLTDEFVEVGFVWMPDFIDYFLIHDNELHPLWHVSDPTFIPHQPASVVMNVWHNEHSWKDDTPMDYPLADAVFEVDWFEYSEWPGDGIETLLPPVMTEASSDHLSSFPSGI